MYNPDTSFVFSISIELHKDENSKKISSKTSKYILSQMDLHLRNEHYFDYFSAKTFLVIEILSNLINGHFQMAESLYTIVYSIYTKHLIHLESIQQYDYGKRRIKEFMIHEIVDNFTPEYLYHNDSVSILMGLYAMGYQFHPQFISHCPLEIQFLHKL